MSLVWKERFKLFILILLILTSLIQVGILWNYQDYSFPTDILSAFFLAKSQKNLSEDYEELIRGKYFVPDRVILSEGYDNPRWIVEQQSKDYEKLWEEARYYLGIALQSEPVQQLGVDQWGKLMASRSVIFEFKSNLNKNILSWFLDKPEAASSSASGVYKMIILPEENLNYNMNTIYIRDDSRIYKYTIQYPENLMSRTDYSELFKHYENDDKAIQYALLREKYNISSISQDVLGVMKGPGYGRYSSVICDLPEELKTSEIYDSRDVDKIADAVLGAEKYGYERSWDSENTVEFKTHNNIYRLFKDGFLDYRYLSGASGSDKGSIGEAFMQAAMFLEQIEPISANPNITLCLSQIEETSTFYRFYFDYEVGGLPVVIDYHPNRPEGVRMENAFVIEANGKNVLKGYGIVRNFEKSNESELYNIMFVDLINDAYKVHGFSEFGNIADIRINDIYIAYKVEYGIESKKLKPVWIINTPEKSYTIPMREK